jgi:hypothetical protein
MDSCLMLQGPFEWSVGILMVTVVAVIGAWYAVDALHVGTTDATPARTVLATAKEIVEAPDPPPTNRSVVPTERAPTRTWYRFVGARGDSWLQVRAGSPAARILYDGTLAEGAAVRFRVRALWVRFGSTNVNLSVAGERVTLPSMGTFDAYVTRDGISRDPVFHPDPLQATAAQSP